VCALLALVALSVSGARLSTRLAAAGAETDAPAQVLKPVRTAKDAPCTGYARQDNCVGNPPLTPGPLPPCAGFTGPLPANATAFAIVGDYGLDGQCMAQVASLVLKLEQQFGTLAFLMTLGDNAYWTGACESLETGVGKYYKTFLPGQVAPKCTDPLSQLTSKKRAAAADETNPHLKEMRAFEAHQALVREQQAAAGLSHHAQKASETRTMKLLHELQANATLQFKGQDAPVRFYPALGNHDWTTYGTEQSTMPYFQYFGYLAALEPASLAAGQFYRVMSPIPGVELYSLNSNLGSGSSPQPQKDLFPQMVNWLKNALLNSTAPFKLVYFHHPPFSTAQHDTLSPWMDLDYESWGVSAVLVGHEHAYERFVLSKDGGKTTMPYVLNGLGGHPWTYQIDNCPVAADSQFRYNAYHGAQLAIHSFDEKTGQDKIDVCFYSLEDGGKVVDNFEIAPTPIGKTL